MKNLLFISMFAFLLISCGQSNQTKKTAEKATVKPVQSEWIPLFNGKDLSNWFVRGKANWSVKDGIMVGEGGMGHIYSKATAKDFEVEGTFRISDNGNSGLYFRCNPPKDNPDGWPQGYEAQIDNHQDAYTGWLWLPGKPTAKAKELITKDNEWFTMKVKMVGDKIQIWVNGELMTEYTDDRYKEGHFAIQGHNPGQTIEVKELKYRNL